MVRQKNKFPKQGEFIVGKVSDIQNQYVYVDLIDYNEVLEKVHNVMKDK